mmetsp:Transcript_949/g.1301  ORF Transcript_949/g.1301 Transcript_949/m.1301 type:complete len:166 (-) Transcript_949:83-580(-)
MCNGMTLTRGLFILGVVYLISALTNGIMQLWFSMTLNLIAGAVFVAHGLYPRNNTLWLVMSFGYPILQAIALLAFLVLSIYMLASDWKETWCENVLGNYDFSDQGACEDWVKKVLIGATCIVSILGIALSGFVFVIIILQVLKQDKEVGSSDSESKPQRRPANSV